VSLLGLDIGTSGCKAVLFNLDGQILSSAYQEYSPVQPQPGWLEIDPEVMWLAIAGVIRQVVSTSSAQDPVQAIGVSALGDCVTPIGRDGKTLYNTVLGSGDTRAEAQCDWWARTFGLRTTFELTGLPLHPMYSLLKVLWFQENEPDLFARTWKWLGWEELFFHRLGLEPVIDPTLAARILAMDLSQRQWSTYILDRIGLDMGLLPKIVPSATVVGEVPAAIAKELGLPRRVYVATGGFDQACAAYGAAVLHTGMAVDNTGTVECVTTVFDTPRFDQVLLDGHYCVSSYVYPNRFMSMAFIVTSGAILRWYRDHLGIDEVVKARRVGADPYEVILATATEGPSPVYVLPYFAGTGTPWVNPRARGSIVGLTMSTTRAQILKGILDSLAYELRINMEMWKKAGISVQTLRATGGGAKSSRWLQLKADILNVCVEAVNINEGGALAAAVMAGVAIGAYSDLDVIGQIVRVRRVFEPHPAEHERYEEHYQKYRNLCSIIAPLNI
jgi:xylulokinase